MVKDNTGTRMFKCHSNIKSTSLTNKNKQDNNTQIKKSLDFILVFRLKTRNIVLFLTHFYPTEA